MEDLLPGVNYEIIRKVLEKNRRTGITTSPLKKIKLQNTKSLIIKENDSNLYCCKFTGIEGLFRKDYEPTKVFGRALCDLVKIRFQCGGFFSSDELPRYGITRKEVRTIFTEMNKIKDDRDLIVIFSYTKELSEQIKSFLEIFFGMYFTR